MEIKRKEYIFKDKDGKNVTIEFTFTERTRKLLKSMTDIDIENVESLKDAKIAQLLLKLAVTAFILKALIWGGFTGFLVYNVITCVGMFDTVIYGAFLLVWLLFTL